MIDLTFSQSVWLPLRLRFHRGVVALVQLMGLMPNISVNQFRFFAVRKMRVEFCFANILQNISKPGDFDDVHAVCGEFCYFPFISRHWTIIG